MTIKTQVPLHRQTISVLRGRVVPNIVQAQSQIKLVTDQLVFLTAGADADALLTLRKHSRQVEHEIEQLRKQARALLDAQIKS